MQRRPTLPASNRLDSGIMSASGLLACVKVGNWLAKVAEG
jgi:hypothetical protein